MGVSILEALRTVTRAIAYRIPNSLTVQNNKLFLARDYMPISNGVEIKVNADIQYHNVYFYNEDTLLQTIENVPHGSSATYIGATPIKQNVENPEDYVFIGWTPSVENITEDTVCYAIFKFVGYLFGKLDDVNNLNWDVINAYWGTINSDVEAYKNGTMSEEGFVSKYPHGGRMLVPIELSNGTVVADVEIVGHNHDDMADNSGKAPLTFFCANLPSIVMKMNEAPSNDGGWENATMREFVNGELFDGLPSQLRSVIKQVVKKSDGGTTNKSIVQTSDKCWLASSDEVGLTHGDSYVSGQGELYRAIFSNDNSRRKQIVDSTLHGGWWLRSSYYSVNNHNMFWRVTTSGSEYSDNGNCGRFYVAFGFCI